VARVDGEFLRAALDRARELLFFFFNKYLFFFFFFFFFFCGAGGASVGFGNRSTINAWIGAHLVVADATAGVIWVCEPWHGLGRALAFDVDGPRPDLAPLAADPELAFEEAHAEEYRRLVEDCNAQLHAGARAEAAVTAARLLALNPDGFEANALAAQASGDVAKRRALLERARTLQPAYRADRERIGKLIAETR
jgi:hypothetical protein